METYKACCIRADLTEYGKNYEAFSALILSFNGTLLNQLNDIEGRAYTPFPF